MSDLKPCWKCGSTNIRIFHGNKTTIERLSGLNVRHIVDRYFCRCENCWRSTPGADTREDAIEVWNHVADLMEELDRHLDERLRASRTGANNG